MPANQRIIRLTGFLLGGSAIDGALRLGVDEQIGRVMGQSGGEMGATTQDITRRDVRGFIESDDFDVINDLFGSSDGVTHAEFNFKADGNVDKDLLIGKSGQNNGIIFESVRGGVSKDRNEPLVWRCNFIAVFNETNTKFLATTASEYDTGNTALAKIANSP